MPDKAAVPQATAEEAEKATKETPNEEPTPAPEAAENTEGDSTGGEHGSQTIPYTRFREVNEQRKAALKESEELKERLAKIEAELASKDKPEPKPKPAQAKTGDLEMPPDEITDPTQRAYWMIQNWGLKAFQEATGVSLDEIGQFVRTQKMSSAEREWNGFCGQYGLDPKDEMVKRVMRGVVAAGEDPDLAAAELAKRLGVTKQTEAPTQKSPARVETDGLQSPSLTPDLFPILNADEASRMAAQGKAVPYKSTTDIFAASSKKK